MLHNTLDTTVDYFGRPATFFATYGGKAGALKALLEDPRHLAHINLGINSQGDHTLLFIALYGDATPETVALLLGKGADPLHRDNIGRISLHIAAHTAHPAILEILLAQPGVSALVDDPAILTGQTPFHALCLPGTTGAGGVRKAENVRSSLEVLLSYSKDANISLNMADTNGLTPLMLIKHSKDATLLALCQKVLGEDCFEAVSVPENIDDLLRVDFYGLTPLLTGAFVNNKEAVASELDQGADPDFMNIQSGRNALQVACCGLADGEMVSLILPQITNVLAQDPQGRTALHFAANTGRLDTTTALLENDTIRNNINETDASGRTALHALAMSKGRTTPAAGETVSTREKTIQLLFEKGIDPEIRDTNGYTALELAELFENTVVAERMKACIADRHQPLQAEQRPILEQGEPQQSFLPAYSATSQSPAELSNPQFQPARHSPR